MRKISKARNVYYDIKKEKYKVQFGIDNADVSFGWFASKREAMQVAARVRAEIEGRRNPGRPPHNDSYRAFIDTAIRANEEKGGN